MKSNVLILLLTALLLSACDNKTDGADSRLSTNIEDLRTDAAKIIKEASKDGLAIGTDIKDLMKPPAPTEGDAPSVRTIAWADLVAGGFDAQSIMAKYQSKLQISIEGSPEERELYKLMDAEFNAAPPNLDLVGTAVRIPGFVSPLDQNDGMVGDFLLVPYFGSCIHSPPPPVNQTVLVNPKEGNSISMSKIRRPVWVVGVLKAERTTTELAEAAYKIENAQIEEYSEDQ